MTDKVLTLEEAKTLYGQSSTPHTHAWWTSYEALRAELTAQEQEETSKRFRLLWSIQEVCTQAGIASGLDLGVEILLDEYRRAQAELDAALAREKVLHGLIEACVDSDKTSLPGFLRLVQEVYAAAPTEHQEGAVIWGPPEPNPYGPGLLRHGNATGTNADARKVKCPCRERSELQGYKGVHRVHWWVDAGENSCPLCHGSGEVTVGDLVKEAGA